MFEVVTNKLSAEAQAWDKVERAIQTMVLIDDDWACRAVLALFDLQTPYEQDANETNDKNQAGFSKADADFFGNIAKRLLDKKNISSSQLIHVRQRIMKYRNQLAHLVIGKRGPEYATALVEKVITLGIL